LSIALKYMRGTISTFDRANDGLPYNPEARKTLLVIRAAEAYFKQIQKEMRNGQ